MRRIFIWWELSLFSQLTEKYSYNSSSTTLLRTTDKFNFPLSLNLGGGGRIILLSEFLLYSVSRKICKRGQAFRVHNDNGQCTWGHLQKELVHLFRFSGLWATIIIHCDVVTNTGSFLCFVQKLNAIRHSIIFGNQMQSNSHFFSIRFRSITECNQIQSYDCVRLNSISESFDWLRRG